jgi:RimJ/RimL family protein N-acetyltransferase
MKVPFLAGEKVYLRPVEENDSLLLYKGKNDPAVRETLFLFFPMTLEQAKDELRSWTSSKEIILFTICLKEDDRPVGQTAFVRIDYVSRAAIFYISIYDPSEWAKGYGGEATQLMVNYGFDILNLNRIQLHVFADNSAGVKAYEKAGFVKEGVLRQAMYHHGQYCDFYVMGILREDWEKQRR